MSHQDDIELQEHAREELKKAVVNLLQAALEIVDEVLPLEGLDNLGLAEHRERMREIAFKQTIDMLRRGND